MATTKIQWTDKSWNPITGCTPCSEGCVNCYAKKMANRLRGRFGYPQDDPFKVTVHRDKFSEPFTWKKPNMVFTVSMGDLFHLEVDRDDQRYIYRLITALPQHTFQILTKRPKNALEFYTSSLNDESDKIALDRPNLWIGVTVENQKRAEERIPILKQIPAQTRFLSVEPMLEAIDLTGHLKGIDWVICGGETGQGARQFNPDWAMDLLNQCNRAGTPFFFKSFGIAYPEPKHLILEMQKNFPIQKS